MNGLPTTQDDPRLDNWYHTIELGNGLVSKGMFDHRSVVDRYGIPPSLEGKTALDVGTGDGFFAFELERRGAARVVATDVATIGDCDFLPRMRARLGDSADSSGWQSRFRLAHDMRRSKVEYRFCSVYDLSPYTVGTFDVVFCGSLLLHLQNPLGALLAIRSVTRETAIVETAIDPDLEQAFPSHPFFSFGFRGEEEEPGENTSYWLCTTGGLQRMLTYAGFRTTEPQGSFLLPPIGPTGTSVVAHVTGPAERPIGSRTHPPSS